MKFFIFVLLLGAWGCSSFLYYPTKKVYYDPKKFNLLATDVWIDSESGEKIHGWLFESKTKPSLGSILFFHGNAENLTSHYMHLAWLPEQGYSFLIFDYPGFGQSTGEPSPKNTVMAGEAALKWLHNYDPRPLIIYGQSLGGAVAQRVAVDLKEQIPLRAVVLDSTFNSYQKIARRKIGQSWITWIFQPLAYVVLSDRWTADEVSIISPVPALVIHGQADRIVEPEFGDELYAQLKEPKTLWKIEGGQHTDVFWAHNLIYRKKFVDWLSQRGDLRQGAK